MMGHREALRGGVEWDYLTRARRYFFKRAGKFTAVKRRFNKRVRKVARLTSRPTGYGHGD